jgi:chromatin remodeling complex protein RSC6
MAAKKAKKAKKAAKKKVAKKKTAKKAKKKVAKKKVAKKATKKKAAKKTAKKAKKKAAKKTVKKAKKAAKKAAKKPAKKAKKKGKRKPNAAFMRALQPDAALAAVVGTKKLPRTQITKKIWEYIKRRGLQDKVNRRQINADDNLKKVFNGKKSVSMFEMTKLVNKHIIVD